VAGAAVQWLRDGLQLLQSASAVEELAQGADPEQPVVFVPGFVGLGAPHWVPEARGVLFGLTRGTTAAELGQATLEGVAFQGSGPSRRSSASTPAAEGSRRPPAAGSGRPARPGPTPACRGRRG